MKKNSKALSIASLLTFLSLLTSESVAHDDWLNEPYLRTHNSSSSSTDQSFFQAFANLGISSATNLNPIKKPSLPCATTLRYYYQDSTVNLPDPYGKMITQHCIGSGPMDKEIGIAQNSVIQARGEKNYVEGSLIFDAHPFTAEFDAIHTYTVTRLVFDMYQQDISIIQDLALEKINQKYKRKIESLKELGDRDSANKIKDMQAEIKRNNTTLKALESWRRKPPLNLYPYYLDPSLQIGKIINAFYSPVDHSLKFGLYIKDNQPAGYLCRSFDIVSHEAGHAVLDFLRSSFISGTSPQTGALHEAFGDLTALFNVLNQSELRKEIIKATKGDLSKTSFLPLIGEEFGKLMFNQDSLRDTNNKHTLSQLLKNNPEIHSLSRVFSGTIYDIVVALFAKNISKNENALKTVSDQVRLLVLKSFMSVSSSSPEFEDIVDEMLDWCKKEQDNSLYSIVLNSFVNRGILENKEGYPISSKLTVIDNQLKFTNNKLTSHFLQ